MDYTHFSEKMGGGATAPQPPASYASALTALVLIVRANFRKIKL